MSDSVTPEAEKTLLVPEYAFTEFLQQVNVLIDSAHTEAADHKGKCRGFDNLHYLCDQTSKMSRKLSMQIVELNEITL